MNVGINIDMNNYKDSPPDLSTAEGIRTAVLKIKDDYINVGWDNKAEVLASCHNRLEYLMYYYLPIGVLATMGWELDIDNWSVKLKLKNKVTKEEYFYDLDFEPDFMETLDKMINQAKEGIVENINKKARMFDMYATHDINRMMYLTDLKFNKLEVRYVK